MSDADTALGHLQGLGMVITDPSLLIGPYLRREALSSSRIEGTQASLSELGNHTWSHPDLRALSTQGIQDQLQRNEDFIQATYGVSAKPFYRPPFGYVNAHVRSAAAAIGYTAPTLWYGSLSDSSALTSDQVAGFVDQWFGAGRIVIAHANHPGVIGAMQHLGDLIAQRGVRTVTLRDVFATSV